MNLRTSGRRIIPSKLGVCATAWLFFFSVQALESQQPVGDQYFIERIEIVGYRRVQNSAIQAHILSRSGGPYNAEAAQRDAQALRDTGYFNEVRLRVEDSPDRPNGQIVVFAVVEKPTIAVQVPTEHPELIAGPWEVVSAFGIDGISFEIVTSSSGPIGQEQFDWQTMNIRVYHREGGKETWGYFATKEMASPQSYSMQDDNSFTLFDGERLRIHSIGVTELKPFDLDITFSPTSNKWSGTWSHSGAKLQVVLTRPEPNRGVRPSVFVGDWIGESVPKFPHHFAPGRLHIRESLDGVLSSWLDRTISGIDPKTGSVHKDQCNGEWLKVVPFVDFSSSVTVSGLVLETTNPTGPPSQFRVSLSEDHQVLTGTWDRPGGGGLNAPDKFRKVLD
jgi:hypothetical protein